MNSYQRWREMPFPESDLDDDLDDIHANLALYDAEVADSVVGTRKGIIGVVPLPLVERIEQLRLRAIGLTGEGESRARRAASYADYAEALLDVCRDARAR